MANEKELRAAAKELIEVLGLVDEKKEDIVVTKSTPIKEVKKIINDVITEKLITPTDELSDATKEVLESMKVETPKESAERLHKENILNAAPNSVKGMDKPEEEESDAEEPKKKKPVKAKAETKAKPVPVKKEKKKERNAMKTRVACVCGVLSTIPSKGKTLNELCVAGDNEFAKVGGTSNTDQTMRYLRVLILAAIEWEIVSKKDNKYFPVV